MKDEVIDKICERISVYHKFMLKELNDFRKEIAEKIIKYYNEEEKDSYGPEDKEEFNKKYGNDTEDNGIGVKIVNEEVAEIGF